MHMTLEFLMKYFTDGEDEYPSSSTFPEVRKTPDRLCNGFSE